MKIVKPKISVETSLNQEIIIRDIELIGRVCYKSEDLITQKSAESFIRKIIANGHETVIEHYNITVRVICDRGVSHQIVRHRIASYSQESTRYCNYSKNKFGHEISVIEPCFWNNLDEVSVEKKKIWKESMERSEKEYFQLLKLGASPEEARSVLPNSLKTELVMTLNLREWRHFIRLRTSKQAHPQIREIALMIFSEFKRKIPIFFEDITEM